MDHRQIGQQFEHARLVLEAENLAARERYSTTCAELQEACAALGHILRTKSVATNVTTGVESRHRECVVCCAKVVSYGARDE